MYVLDTDRCIELLRRNEGISFKLGSLTVDIEIVSYTTTITAAELFYKSYVTTIYPEGVKRRRSRKDTKED